MKLSKEDIQILNNHNKGNKVKQVDVSIGSYYVKYGYDNVATIKMIFRELLEIKILNLLGVE